MTVTRELLRQMRDAIAPVIGISVIGYFVYHSIEGQRGLSAYVRLTERLGEARSELNGLERERTAFERRVSLMRPEHLDPDLLDERARLILNLGRPDEIVILDAPSTGSR
jgi:cell division protein FtsB